MSNYTFVTVELPGEERDWDIQVPNEWLPRAGEVLNLSFDTRFPTYARRHITIAEVRWYKASGERYRPVLVLDV